MSDQVRVTHITYEELRAKLSRCILARSNLGAAQALLSEALRSETPAMIAEFWGEADDLIEGALASLIEDDDDETSHSEDYI